MKKLILSIAIPAYLLAGCSGNQQHDDNGHEHGPGTHEHHDGDHHHDDTAVKQQEEFTVPADTSKKEELHGHPHSQDGHEHPHKH